MSEFNSNIFIISGSRQISKEDRNVVMSNLDLHCRYADIIVHGGARGVDLIAGSWALEKYKPCLVVPAAWSKFGNSAGPIRNKEMLSLFPKDLVTLLAFPKGESKGTRGCIKLAQGLGIQTIVYELQ